MGVNKHFGGLHAVNNVSFTVEECTIKSVIGPNGAGKTTLFNLIAGYHRLDSGVVEFNGKTIQGLHAYEITSRGISRTFQNIKLFSRMTVLENVMTGRHVRTSAGFIAAALNTRSARNEGLKIREKARELLELLQVSDLEDRDAGSLPFGKQRYVEIARALAAEPKLLLLDEPAAGLNIHETQSLAELILKIKSALGITVLMVEHDMSLVMDISDSIAVLNYGEKIADGTPKDIQQNLEVIKVYLGDDSDA